MRKVISITVIVAALGYFVDMFDLTIFGVVRMSSLKAIGITDPAEVLSKGIWLVNLQALGMLTGGLLWGILADKKGRLSVLFASILIYSVANILNAFVTTLTQYEILRFIAGVGLAGELGAAVTLVSEMLSKEDRGYGTTIIAALGLLGAVAASLIGQLFTWQTAYLVGGVMGLLLLLTRFKMADSTMFQKQSQSTSRGDLRLLFQRNNGPRYLFCILLGVPIYFSTAILFTFSPELAKTLGLENITAGNAILAGTIGLTLGDLGSGLLSQWLKSRKKAVLISLMVGFVFSFLYFATAALQSNILFYFICSMIGLAAGYWAVLITMAAEQFGTNIRATVATSVPNFVRASVIPMTLLFTTLRPSLGASASAMMMGAGVYALALLALWKLQETYGKELDYMEAREMQTQDSSLKTKVFSKVAIAAGLLLLVTSGKVFSAENTSETSLTQSAPRTTRNWTTSTNAAYFNMNGTTAAINNSYSFGHVDVSVESVIGSYKINPNWKITGQVNTLQNTYELIAGGKTYVEKTQGLGDTQIESVHTLVAGGPGETQVSVDAGISLPTGNDNQNNVFSAVPAHYKYFLQLGSGTIDGVLGFTALNSSKYYTLGARLSSVLRSGVRNSNGYHLGNLYRGDLWAETPLAYGLNAKASIYDRVRGAITGNDSTLNPATTTYYYRDQVDWMAATALNFRHQFAPELGMSAEIGLPVASGMINADNVVITPAYYASLSLTGQF